ncbi:hypothetical protein AVEN_267736-1 [Araneus ventricosus]|uniref:Uncharacterized protein n=1 Tax=Araneus ventricosus TaxID=182803 RepID=A0A4Y2CXA7_ARAVE|nr:hypothetical protein AVEN_267736-1 [Araneus ventricosus]
MPTTASCSNKNFNRHFPQLSRLLACTFCAGILSSLCSWAVIKGQQHLGNSFCHRLLQMVLAMGSVGNVSLKEKEEKKEMKGSSVLFPDLACSSLTSPFHYPHPAAMTPTAIHHLVEKNWYLFHYIPYHHFQFSLYLFFHSPRNT